MCGGGQQLCAAVPMRTDLTSHCHQLSCCLSLPLPNLAADVPAGARATTMELVQEVGTVRFVPSASQINIVGRYVKPGIDCTSYTCNSIMVPKLSGRVPSCPPVACLP